MKKTTAIILTIFSLILILDSMSFGHAIAMFLLAGIIPGTNIIISGGQMLTFFALMIGFTLARVSIRIIFAYRAYRESEQAITETS